MSNHFHLIIETNPQAAWEWSDAKVAARWLSLIHKNVDHEPTLEKRIASLVSQPERLDIYRERLGSLSWFMRYLKEPIARRANKEDECTGRFWEGRFRTQNLLDDAAILSSMVYVDLNPVRAKIANTPEKSVHTSIYRRIEQLEAHHEMLTPLSSSIAGHSFSLTFAHYRELLDWTALSLYLPKHGSTGNVTPHTLTRLNLRKSQWLLQVPATESQFWRAIGSVESMLALAQRRGQRWIRGLTMARRLRRAS